MNIQMAKGASFDSVSSVRSPASEVSMATVHVSDLPPGTAEPATTLARRRPDLAEHEDPDPIARFRRPTPGPIEDAALADTDDDLKPARGFMNAVLLAVPLWGLIGLLTWLVVRW
jgi:hypothetical protein